MEVVGGRTKSRISFRLIVERYGLIIGGGTLCATIQSGKIVLDGSFLKSRFALCDEIDLTQRRLILRFFFQLADFFF